MKYELTEPERQKINTGEIITFAAYTPEKAALCEYVANYNGIKLRWQESESPTGKQIFIGFLFPHNYSRAFHAGSMLERGDIYMDEDKLKPLLKSWKEKFTTHKAVQA